MEPTLVYIILLLLYYIIYIFNLFIDQSNIVDLVKQKVVNIFLDVFIHV